MQLIRIEKEKEFENDFWIPLVGSRVLCKVEGYPDGPGMIIPIKLAPTAIIEDRPKIGDDLYLVSFYHDSSYYWAIRDDLSLLTNTKIELFLNDKVLNSQETTRPFDQYLIKAYKDAKKYSHLSQFISYKDFPEQKVIDLPYQLIQKYEIAVKCLLKSILILDDKKESKNTMQDGIFQIGGLVHLDKRIEYPLNIQDNNPTTDADKNFNNTNNNTTHGNDNNANSDVSFGPLFNSGELKTQNTDTRNQHITVKKENEELQIPNFHVSALSPLTSKRKARQRKKGARSLQRKKIGKKMLGTTAGEIPGKAQQRSLSALNNSTNSRPSLSPAKSSLFKPPDFYNQYPYNRSSRSTESSYSALDSSPITKKKKY
ncbi:uncharacterized protein ASCRUDRAFT_80710 [Ascoidea rubescens DSM 1968]|uniref:PWWP domain-containing protein n=1 Tax=Ascoidea rubescens DSM 1968 TaxID=1344418 RepID=A0A1D2VJ76_9ASCO|nr:hypothetical protein ASCRUDRAFT_80710 [Ascoidea rubescens DSM 1968]ODV61682.1 hypothetical protein ASCRUDRAFT_80710 [Ascoidea rubescens DSM 1968]